MINTVSLTGRLTADPERRDVAGDRTLCTFRLAVERLGPKPRHTDFIPIECWDGIARSVADHLRKGRLVGVVGSVRQDSWTSDDGAARSRYYIAASAVHFLDRPTGDNDSADRDGDLAITQ